MSRRYADEQPSEGPPFTEPVPVRCLLLTGISIEIKRRHTVRFVGWAETPDLGGETDERRIEVRFALDRDDALAFRENMNRMLLRRDER